MVRSEHFTLDVNK